MVGGRLAVALAAAAAIVVGCASCGGSSESAGPVHVSPAAAYANPCMLITQAQAQVILGKAGRPEFESGIATESGFKTNYCDIRDAEKGTTIDIAVETQSFDPLAAQILIKNAAPAAGVGHQAVCGLSLQSLQQPLLPQTFTLYGAINSHYSLEVSGASSCTIDGRFASEAYNHL